MSPLAEFASVGHLTIFGILVVLIAIVKSIAVVSGTKIAVLERRWIGKTIPNGRVVALKDEVGIQARILGPGLHFLFPFIYKIQKH